MTYKGSNWTRGELGHPAPDPNAPVPCHGCGRDYPFRGYWKERVIEGERVEDPHEEQWRCDRCHEIHERRRANQSLAEFWP